MNDNDEIKATGMSAFERDVRNRLAEAGLEPADDYITLPVEVGVLRGLLRDIEMWREMARDINEDGERMQRAIESLENERRGERQ